MFTVEIADSQNLLSIDRTWYAELARFTLRSESVPSADLSVAFVDDATIHRLNHRFLNHDYPTDVVTFPLSAPGNPIAGEIVIGCGEALRQAEEFDCPAQAELALYLIHGILHLCGYDDRDEPSASIMRRRQESLLQQFQSNSEAQSPVRAKGDGHGVAR